MRETAGDDGTAAGLTLALHLAAVPRGKHSEALATELRAAIRGRRLVAGSRLPATRVLAEALGTSRGTVVRAYEQLVAEGYLFARQGRGTEVAPVSTPPDAGPLRSERRPTNPGLPAGSTFPRRAWARCATRALATLPDADLGYGDPAGLAALRREVVAYLGRVRATSASPDQVVIVNGFAQAARLLADVLLRRGIHRVGVEDPGSAGLREQLAYASIDCVGIPLDDEGIRVDALDRSGVRAVFVTPAHQFPTGVVLSPGRRRDLLAWAAERSGLVIEDDYDAELRYDRAPIGALQGLDPDHVVYGGSVSKTLAPGIRLGWLIAPEPLVRGVVEAKYAADLGTGVLEQATLAELLSCGAYERHLRHATRTHRRARDRLVAALADRLPDWRVSGAAAGLHLVAAPPAGDEAAIAQAASEAGLDARPLGAYAIAPTDGPALVIGYGHQRPEHLDAAVRALATRLGNGR
jgi:GntR family transcriptional regulator/MocR family aminotransferase